MKVFMYCEWIDDERVRRSMPNAKMLDRVRLPNHRLVFTTFVEDSDKTERGSGCHMEPSPGDVVHGLMFDLTEEEVSTAERLSRVAEGRYTGQTFRVVDSHGEEHDAVAYVIKHPIGSSTPSDEYRDHMLVGARKHEFPGEYLSMLERI